MINNSLDFKKKTIEDCTRPIFSKNRPQNIIFNIQKDSCYNLWKNSFNAKEWFRNIKDKNRTTFIQFDIIEFYPSIPKDLLLKSLNDAKNFREITEEQIEIILTCRKFILTENKSTWIKKKKKKRLSHPCLRLCTNCRLDRYSYIRHSSK